MMNLEKLHPDCRHFRGHIPCSPHKKHGVHCDDCTYYEPLTGRILIIKLGAIGDVIRSTPILHRLKKEYPKAEIFWLTQTPIVVPKFFVDHVLPYDHVSLTWLRELSFDLLINLDKDADACALANSLAAGKKIGFLLKDGRPWPADENAVHKFMTGLFDDLSKANTKSYPQELFELCGYEFHGEKYILDTFEGQYEWPIDKSQKVIGLNTGCGSRWTSRLWPEEYWIELAQRLLQKGYFVLLLGGKEEDAKNRHLARESGAVYLGHFPLRQFINEINQCDLVVTAVTLAMHITIGLGKKIVLFNNTFNRHEFELYGLGEILEPEFDCDCYYAQECPNNCMQYIYVDRVLQTIEKILNSE